MHSTSYLIYSVCRSNTPTRCIHRLCVCALEKLLNVNKSRRENQIHLVKSDIGQHVKRNIYEIIYVYIPRRTHTTSYRTCKSIIMTNTKLEHQSLAINNKKKFLASLALNDKLQLQ